MGAERKLDLQEVGPGGGSGGRPRFLSPKEQQAQRKALADAITAEIEKAPPPGARLEQSSAEGQGWAIPGLPAEKLDRLAASGKFNPAQLAHLRAVSEMVRQGAGDSALFFYQPAMNARKQYASLAGDWRTETPYQIFVSKAGNVLFRTISREKLMANAQEMVARKRAGLWDNQLPALVRDIDTYLANHAAGRSGAEGIGIEKRDQINALFGIDTRANAAANPFRETAPRSPIVIRSRRLDHTNQLTQVEETFPTNYELLNRNLRPEGGEPTKPEMPSSTPRLDIDLSQGDNANKLLGALTADPLPAAPQKLTTLENLFREYESTLVGKTVRTPLDQEFSFKPGHFFNIVASKTDSAPRKGLLGAYANAEEARAAVRRGEVGFEDLPGFERDRARYMGVLPDLLQRPHAILGYEVGAQPRLAFVKRYALPGFDGFVAAGFELEGGRRLALLSFHPHHLESRFFRNKRLVWSDHWKW